MKIKEKVFDGHIHTLMRVPVRESLYLFDREFEELGVDKFCFASCPLHEHGDVEMDKLQNMKCLYYKAIYSPDAYAYCDLEHDFDMPLDQRAEYYLNQAKENLAHGFDGFKILEGMPKYLKKLGLKLSDAVYEPFWAYLEENGVPVLIHLGHPKRFWDRKRVGEYWIKRGCFYGEGSGYPAFYEIIEDMFAVMDKHPQLKLTLAHFGFMSEDYDLAERFMKYPNTKFDVTPGGEQLINMLNGDKRQTWIDFIVKNIDRIKYGTDLYQFEYVNEKQWLKAIHTRPDMIRQVFGSNKEHDYAGDKFVGIKLPKKLRKKIYRDNLLNELGEPKPIDYDWAIDKIKKLREEFSDVETLDGYDLMCMENDLTAIKEEE